MVESRATDFALTNGIFVYEAQNGLEKFKGMKAANIRGVGPVSTSWFHMTVMERSGIKTYMDLKDKRVNFAQKGSNTEHMTSLIVGWLGIDKTLRKDYMRWDQAAEALKDGRIDAFSIPNPIPSPSVLSASTGGNILVLSLPDSVIEKFEKMNPGYYADTVPPGSYKGMEKTPIKTIAYTIFSVAHKDVPAEVVYKVVKVNYDPQSADFLVNAMKGWKIGLDTAKNPKFLGQMQKFGLKLHPGAERYWKEKGYVN